MPWTDNIRADPAIAGGKPVLRNSRLSVAFILALLAEGWTREQLLASYPSVTDDALRAVFLYAADELHDQRLLPIRPGAA